MYQIVLKRHPTVLCLIQPLCVSMQSIDIISLLLYLLAMIVTMRTNW